MTNISTPTTRPIVEAVEEGKALALPNNLRPGPRPDEVFTALAQDHPALIGQLRGMFFATSFKEQSASYSDGEILKIAATLYSNDNLRALIVESNRTEGRPLLDLGMFRDEIEERGTFLLPERWEDLPDSLRLIDQAVRQLPTDSLVCNSLFIPTPELIAAAIDLTVDDLCEIENATSKISVRGERYSEAAQKMIDP